MAPQNSLVYLATILVFCGHFWHCVCSETGVVRKALRLFIEHLLGVKPNSYLASSTQLF